MPDGDERPPVAPSLPERLEDRIRSEGAITFAEFMEAALYDSEEGFYSRSPVGERGDFVTAPHVSSAFGVLVARQVEGFFELIDKPDPFWVVEAGAGDGTLAGQILEFLPTTVQAVTHYVAVERSGAGRRAMEELDALVLSEMGEVASGLVGCVLANELLDNLPFHWLRGTASGPAELHVGLEGDRLALIERPPSTSQVAELSGDLAPGQEAVVHPQALRFLDQAAAALERGYIWLVDYGFSGGERPGAPHGYRGHRLEGDVLTDPGSRDITAGVDFDALARHARDAGHAVWGPVSQRDALIALGYRELDDDARRRQVQTAAEGRGIEAMRIYSARGRATILVDPTALGGFLVLCIGVGVDLPPTSIEGGPPPRATRTVG